MSTTQPQATSELTLGYIEASGEALHEAQKLAASVVAEGEKVAHYIPLHVDAMKPITLHNGRPLLAAGHEKDAAEALGTHEGALKIVGNLIELLRTEKQAHEQQIALLSQGRGVSAASLTTGSQKQASVASDDLSGGGYVGRRQGAGEKSAADRAMITGLGLAGQISG